MTLIRPELRAALWPWREAMVGALVAGLGLYWALTSFGLMRWVAVALILGGAALLFQGIQRARIPATGSGPGVVEVDERQVTYFGPGGGAAISIDTLVRVEFDALGGRHWHLHADGAPPLTLPADAAGVEVLFDALAALPGFDTQAAIRAARGSAQGLFVIWQRDRARLH